MWPFGERFQSTNLCCFTLEAAPLSKKEEAAHNASSQRHGDYHGEVTKRANPREGEVGAQYKYSGEKETPNLSHCRRFKYRFVSTPNSEFTWSILNRAPVQ